VPKDSRWKKIFGNRKPTVPVRVGDNAEEMTETQAYRFDELTQTDQQDARPVNDNPLDQSRYSLADAAFRLMTDEADLLQRAAANSIKLYTDVAGLAGRWRRMDGNGDAVESSLRTLRSGYLELSTLSCLDLASIGSTNVSVFELPDIFDPSTLELDAETLRDLSAWGSEKKCFCVTEPKRVSTDEVILLAPLSK
jgi:hypothetical protein